MTTIHVQIICNTKLSLQMQSEVVIINNIGNAISLRMIFDHYFFL